MEIKCPNGWVWDIGLPHTITVLAGSCASSDLCGISICEYENDSPEAIQAHVRAALDCGDINIQSEEDRKSELYTRLHKRGLRVIK